MIARLNNTHLGSDLVVNIALDFWPAPACVMCKVRGSLSQLSWLRVSLTVYKNFEPRMNILIYKRTHRNDPDRFGRFGIEGCMGRVRSFKFDAVIGVGGVSGWPKAEGIAGKVNWVGRNPQKRPNPFDKRGPLVTFRRGDFRVMEEKGPLLSTMSALLAAAVYGSRNRFLFSSVRGRLALEAQRVVTALLDTNLYPDTPAHNTRTPVGCGARKCRPVTAPAVAPSRTCRSG